MLRSTQKEATALRSRAERAEEQQVGGSHQETPIFFFKRTMLKPLLNCNDVIETRFEF
jgi:hypothetical protein